MWQCMFYKEKNAPPPRPRVQTHHSDPYTHTPPHQPTSGHRAKFFEPAYDHN